MIIFNNLGDWGRLGNQLWQIASTIGIAKRNSTEFAFNPVWSYNKYFNIQLPVMRIHGNVVDEFRDMLPYSHYVELNLDPTQNWVLAGYFQSEKYFKHCENYIRELLTLKPFYETYIREKFNEHLDRIAIHVRRTDFINNGCTPALALDYYEEALTNFPDNKFLVCSDDINWCKQQDVFKGERFYFVDEKQPDIYDLYLMAYCKGIIIANSSFSWWSAWLGERPGYKVIAPKGWFGGWLSKDVIPERWTRIGKPFFDEVL